MAALDQKSKAPNLIVSILHSLKLSGDAGIARGALETRRGQQEDLQLIVSEDSRTVYQTKVTGSVGLDAYFKDTKSKMLFEMDLMKFRNTIISRHSELWPVVEDYVQINPNERLRRSELLLNMILGRKAK